MDSEELKRLFMSATVAVQNDMQSRQFERVFRGPYRFLSREPLSDEVANKLVHLVRVKFDEAPRGILGGRGRSVTAEIAGLGTVFVKRYTHGGLLRSLTGGRFLNIGPSRSRSEFLMLERVRAIGINAPRPLVYVNKGSVFYNTWLIMEELPDTRTLVEVSVNEPEVLDDCMGRLAQDLRTLVTNKILHVDLHPGNVLVAKDGTIHIVDFDKARLFHGSEAQLRELYLRRWRRAVIKHGLSPVLTESMSLILRSYHE
jgi:3-deoxy-D-manno-octulosonic acid kinase